MRKLFIRFGLLLAGIALLVLPASAQGPAKAGPTLSAVMARREVICGVNQDLFGFGYLDPNTGEVNGFDIDFCRAVAAAVLGDSTLISLLLYPNAAAGQDALRQGEIDILLHNVNWTLTADAQDLVFARPNFYGGQTVMVRGDSPANDWPDLDGNTICVVAESIAESDLLFYLQRRGLNAQLLSLASLNDAQSALDDGRCDALSSDVVQLTILQQRSRDQKTYRVWQRSDQLYTRQPFAPVIRSGDDQWATIVEWTLLGLIEAEQLGISSENVQTFIRQTITQPGQADTLESQEDYISRVGAEVARFLDEGLGIGNILGLTPNFMLPVIREVGNYGEIYRRHLGPEGDLPIERGWNNLSRDGGLFFAPDWR